jgi:hypothetical protein
LRAFLRDNRRLIWFKYSAPTAGCQRAVSSTVSMPRAVNGSRLRCPKQGSIVFGYNSRVKNQFNA